MLRRAAIGMALATACALATPSPAAAYCFAAACDGIDPNLQEASVCEPAQLEDCDGPPLRWTGGCTGFTVHEAGSSQVGVGTMIEVAKQAFALWDGVDCGAGEPPSVHVEFMGEASCGVVEYNKQAGNTNVIVFRDDAWPHADETHSVARTTTTFDPNSGALLDADIEINTATFALTTTELTDSYDLVSVMAHEAGHFLGMGHSADPEATMFRVYQAGTTDLRSLEPDDVAGICALYPPGNKDTSCNPIPKHGFAPDCGQEQEYGDCSALPGRRPGGGDSAPWLMALSIALLRARIASRRP